MQVTEHLTTPDLGEKGEVRSDQEEGDQESFWEEVAPVTGLSPGAANPWRRACQAEGSI
jgi:hypothetical protein